MTLLHTIQLKPDTKISLWRNNEGFIEGYLTTGKVLVDTESVQNHKDCTRVVGIETTEDGFMKFFKAKNKKKRSITSKAKLLNQQIKLL